MRDRFPVLVSIVGLTVTIAQTVGAGSSRYTNAMFRHALVKEAPTNAVIHGQGVVKVPISSAPIYVLVVVKDPKTGKEREICMLGRLLLGAVAEEHHLDVLNDGQKILTIALAAPNRTFSFKNRRARKNVAAVYTLEQLAEVRRLLKGRSPRELRAAAKVDLSAGLDQQSFVTKIYRRTNGPRAPVDSYKLAVGHVLLENGILGSCTIWMRFTLTTDGERNTR